MGSRHIVNGGQGRQRFSLRSRAGLLYAFTKVLGTGAGEGEQGRCASGKQRRAGRFFKTCFHVRPPAQRPAPYCPLPAQKAQQRCCLRVGLDEAVLNGFGAAHAREAGILGCNYTSHFCQGRPLLKPLRLGEVTAVFSFHILKGARQRLVAALWAWRCKASQGAIPLSVHPALMELPWTRSSSMPFWASKRASILGDRVVCSS